MNLTILYWILIAVMLVGVVGAVVPVIPGPSLILVAVLIWGIATGFTGIGWPMVVVFAVLLLSAAVEIIATLWGAKQLGASKWGQIGAIAGMVAGFLGLLPALPLGGPLLGLLIGPMIGAFVGEFLYRRDLTLNERTKQSLQASIGVIVGSLVGNILEALLALVAVIIFISSTWQFVMGT